MSDDPRHQCNFKWCGTAAKGDEGDHWNVVYYPAGGRRGAFVAEGQTPLRLGIGTKYEETEAPKVIVHLDGGRYDVDEDAFLTIAEAVEIHGALGRAISDTCEAMQHLAQSASGATPPLAINQRFPGPFRDLDYGDARTLAITAGQMEDDGCDLTEAKIWRLRQEMEASDDD